MRSAESYLHRDAKAVLASWLRKRARVIGSGSQYKGLQGLPLADGTDCAMLDSVMRGVYLEYPVCKTENKGVVGLRRLCPKECQHVTGWHCFASQHPTIQAPKHGIPTAKQIREYNATTKKTADNPKLKVQYFLDVAEVDHNGVLRTAYEVIHKHECDGEKVAWFDGTGICWHEISALWIMERVKPPFDCTEGIVRGNAFITPKG
jgi:hypothetical protein